MNLTYVDLEMAQPSGKIIEVGWCIADPVTQVVAERGFQFVNPGEPLSDYIKTLTRIKQEDIDEVGQPLETAVMLLMNKHSEHQSFCNPVTWGGGDVEEIKRQVRGIDLKRELDLRFGHRWVDVKTIFQAYQMARGMRPQSGLAKSLIKLGLKFEGTKHRAVDDAYNTYRAHAALLTLIKAGAKLV